MNPKFKVDPRQNSIRSIAYMIGISVEELEKMFSEIFTSDLKSGLEESQNIFQKSVDDLLEQYKSFKVEINFVNKSTNPDPTYVHEGDSGFDLRAFIDTQEGVKTLLPGTWEAIPTGLYFEIPKNYELQVRPRSGIAFNNGVTVLNSPGTVDSGYRGEVSFRFKRLAWDSAIYNVGEKIGQLVILPYPQIQLEQAKELSDTERGANGYGSSGL